MDHLQAPHLAWSVSLLLLADLAEHRRSDVTLQFTSNMEPSTRTEDCKLGPRAKILESLRDKKEYEKNTGRGKELICLYEGKLPGLISVQSVSESLEGRRSVCGGDTSQNSPPPCPIPRR